MVFICIGIIGVLGMVPTGGSGCCSRMLKGERSIGCVNVKGDPVRFDSSGTHHIDVVLGQHLFLLVKENHQPGWWFQKALAMSRKNILL